MPFNFKKNVGLKQSQLRAYLFSAVCFLAAFFIAIALFSYQSSDPSYFFVTSEELQTANWAGKAGAYVASMLIYLWGGAAWGCVILLALLGFGLQRLTLPLLMIQVVMATLLCKHHVEFFTAIAPGGYIGHAACRLLAYGDAQLMMFMLFAVTWIALILLCGFTFVRPVAQKAERLLRLLGSLAWVAKLQKLLPHQNPLLQMRARIFGQVKNMAPLAAADDIEGAVQEVYDALFWQQYTGPTAEAETLNMSSGEVVIPEMLIEQTPTAIVEQKATYKRPDVRSFKAPARPAPDRRQAENQATLLQEKLSRFGIRGSVVKISSGPVVTLFEYQPEIDMPISKIIAREDDLALALQAMSLRIIAPIPGKSVIGFEVSNAQRQTVYFADIIGSPLFAETNHRLPLVIGHDTVGLGVVLDLVAMPHLMVAGSTGSGKSVALNSMLVSLLCHATPDELRFILIDPKRLEFASYADIPHLLFPIVTEAKRAVSVLAYAVRVMEERYERMAAAGVRNIYDYQLLLKKQPELAPMPFMVIVIDELADLMMVTGKEVEGLIARLAQMARAAGIHLILATQRPSVDVITGVIKVNFPVRIACKVTSKVDSRTILDQGGAEKLLGKGDMLLLDSQGRLQRLHGAYVTDGEIQRVVAHVKAQRQVVYEELVEASDSQELMGEDAALFQEVLAFVKTVDEISISLLQRKFRIGYNRSARMIDLLEVQGIVMPASGAKNRKVLH
jgi:DNA segregation ATPase FtsK/SpoIIIE-like protein